MAQGMGEKEAFEAALKDQLISMAWSGIGGGLSGGVMAGGSIALNSAIDSYQNREMKKRTAEVKLLPQVEKPEVKNLPVVEEAMEVQKTAPKEGTARVYHGEILDTVRKNLSKIQTMKPVVSLTGNEFQKIAGDKRNLRTKVMDFFNSLGNKVTRKDIGEIELNDAGARDSTGHGYGKLKAATYAALPAVLEQGKLIDFNGPHEGHDYDSYFIAAPVTVNGTTCYVGALVIKDQRLPRYKLHEVLTTSESGTPLFKSESPDTSAESPLRNGAPLEASEDASTDIILPQGAEDVKSQFAQEEEGYTEKQKPVLPPVAERQVPKPLPVAGKPAEADGDWASLAKQADELFPTPPEMEGFPRVDDPLVREVRRLFGKGKAKEEGDD